MSIIVHVKQVTAPVLPISTQIMLCDAMLHALVGKGSHRPVICYSIL